MKLITISREFGSGGRELGKRIADLLQFEYYDKEIISSIAQESGLDESYVSASLEKGIYHSFPITIGRTFSYPSYLQQNSTKILVAQHKIIKQLALRKNCIIMGQNADVILEECHPFKLFVYAETGAKIRRCESRAPIGEHLTEKELLRKIKQIDTVRRRSREILTDRKWGQKENYHLCINTTGRQIKELAPHIAGYAKYWLGT